MDRSVDSIGSCSLDVDAESTDFSDTSGSLNLQTPSSLRDITREFTSRIKERCQISQISCQQTTTILDPTSGKISTIVTSIASPITSPAKKPSYLNLACCVNGYSNLTTYDSKLRQNINKSREVSPIRPSSNTLQYCTTTLGNYLAPPILINNNKTSPTSRDNKSCNKSTTMMENRNFIVNDHSSSKLTGNSSSNNIDRSDNITNGGPKYYNRTSKYLSAIVTRSSTEFVDSEDPSNTKSFIQQRVERLYGPGALAQGFYSPKKSRSHESTVLCSPNSQTKYSKIKSNSSYLSSDHHNSSNSIGNSNGSITSCRYSNSNSSSSATTLITTTTTNSSSKTTSTTHHYYENNTQQIEDNIENTSSICDELPVLRHLRPEFRAQLPILSPKKSAVARLNSLDSSSSSPAINGVDPILLITARDHSASDKSLNSANGIVSAASSTTTTESVSSLTTIRHVNGKTNDNELSSLPSIVIDASTATPLTSKPKIMPKSTMMKSTTKTISATEQPQKPATPTAIETLSIIDATVTQSMMNANNAADSVFVPSPTKIISNGVNNIFSDYTNLGKNHRISNNDEVDHIVVDSKVHLIRKSINDERISSKECDFDKERTKLENFPKLCESIVSGGGVIENTINFPVVENSSEESTSQENRNRHQQNQQQEQKPLIDDSVRNSGAKPSSSSTLSPTLAQMETTTYDNLLLEDCVRDGHYFLRLLQTKQDRLLQLAKEGENELEALAKNNSDVSDEIFGYLRSASGKARLLASQKMKQFEGLCKNNLNQLPGEKFPTTNEDLQGFWDMVMLQVDHIETLFEEINTLKANGWKKPIETKPTVPQGSKLTRRPNPSKILTSGNTNKNNIINNNNNNNNNNNIKIAVTNGGGGGILKKSTTSQLVAQKREAQRKQLMELKRKHKMAMTAASGTTAPSGDIADGVSAVAVSQQHQPQKNQLTEDKIEIFVNDSSFSS